MKKSIHFLPPVVYYAVIFYLSSRSHFPVAEPFAGFDKIVHAAEFGGLGFLLARAFEKGFQSRWPMKFLFVFLLGAGLGLLDECHQLFVPGRHADLWDAATDAVGIAAGMVVFRWIMRRLELKDKKLSRS
jgi:VanZ family protein